CARVLGRDVASGRAQHRQGAFGWRDSFGLRSTRPETFTTCSSVVAVASLGGRNRRADRLLHAGQYPGALAGREARREQAVVDLAGDRETVEAGRRQEQALVVFEAVRRRVDVALDGRDHAVAVRVDALDLDGI